LGKRMSCAKTDGAVLTIYASKVAFWGRNDCSCVESFSGLNFLIVISYGRPM